MDHQWIDVVVLGVAVAICFLLGRWTKPEMDREGQDRLIQAGIDVHENINKEFGDRHMATLRRFDRESQNDAERSLAVQRAIGGVDERVRANQVDLKTLLGEVRKLNDLIQIQAKRLSEIEAHANGQGAMLSRVLGWVGNISEAYPIATIGKMTQRISIDVGVVRQQLNAIGQRSFKEWESPVEPDSRPAFEQDALYQSVFKKAVPTGGPLTVLTGPTKQPYDAPTIAPLTDHAEARKLIWETPAWSPGPTKVPLSSESIGGQSFVKRRMIDGDGEPSHIHPLAKDEAPCEPTPASDPSTSAAGSAPATPATDSNASPTTATPTTGTTAPTA